MCLVYLMVLSQNQGRPLSVRWRRGNALSDSEKRLKILSKYLIYIVRIWYQTSFILIKYRIWYDDILNFLLLFSVIALWGLVQLLHGSQHQCNFNISQKLELKQLMDHFGVQLFKHQLEQLDASINKARSAGLVLERNENGKRSYETRHWRLIQRNQEPGN